MAEAADACHKHGMKYKICEIAHLRVACVSCLDGWLFVGRRQHDA